MSPGPRRETGNVRLLVPRKDLRRLSTLPWNIPLEEWHRNGVRILSIKSGLSRHVVRFVAAGRERYAIKETAPASALREFDCYAELGREGIPTLEPVGVVSRYDGRGLVRTPVGEQTEEQETGYLVTRLMEKVIPDSYLFRRGFSADNRKRIWDAIIDLFVQLHANGTYWGDASLANMLIHFSAEVVPELGRRTRLRAVLADAETVETRPSISASMRQADLDFFQESMLWTEADLRASGIVRDPLITRDDQRYLVEHYHERYAVELETRSFELVTHIDVDKLLGSFDAKGRGVLLLQHINEHKWYVSERLGRDVGLVESAEDWYRSVFKPVCRIFSDYGLLEFFPEKTAANLYVEIMEHKYYMSQKESRDVGLVAALEDYVTIFAPEGSPGDIVGAIVRALRSLVDLHHSPRNVLIA
jgi:hypothetical protein